MMYPYCKYSDETEVVFSNIMKKEKKSYMYILKDQQSMDLIL